MVTVRSNRQVFVQCMREAGQVAAQVLKEVCDLVQEGVSTYDLDQAAKKIIAGYGAESACYQYEAGGNVYPNHICLSINSEVVHGISTLQKVIQKGDLVSVDVVTRYRGYIGDNARTILVPPVAPEAEQLVKDTEAAFFAGLDKVKAGARVGDISAAIEKFLKERGYGIVKEFVGHGIGRGMHEEPQIPNYGKRKTGPKLKEGQVIAIEPMVNLGSEKITMLPDGWTAVTEDRSLSAHYENSVLVLKDRAEILTFLQN